MSEFDPKTELSKESMQEFSDRLIELTTSLGIDDKVFNKGIDHFCIRTPWDADTEKLIGEMKEVQLEGKEKRSGEEYLWLVD